MSVLCYFLYFVAGVLLLVITPVVYLATSICFRLYTANLPSDIPWVGLNNRRWLPKLRATFRQITAKRGPLEEGYEKYGRFNKPYILPILNWPGVVLPPSNIRWLVNQPENVLAATKVQDEVAGLPDLTHGPDAAAVHDFSIISRDLTRQIGKISNVLFEEVGLRFTEQLGLDTESWTEVKIGPAIEKAVSEVISRISVSEPISSNKRYLFRSHIWSTIFGVGSLILGHGWQPLRSPIAQLLSLATGICKWSVARLMYPEIYKRIDQLRMASQHEEKAPLHMERKNDILQWIIESDFKYSIQPPDPWNIVGRTMLYHLFAEHTTSNTTSTALFDMFSYASARDLIAELREEAESILPSLATDPYCTRHMVKMDSFIHESMRHQPMFGHALLREVVVPGGITTPDGLHLPQGCHVLANVAGMQRDQSIYDRGDEFQPFRFCEDATGARQKGAVVVSDDFLTFSLGKHACPGRFFAVQVMKLILGYLVINYDFEPLDERPEFTYFGELTIPPRTAAIRIRRRKVPAVGSLSLSCPWIDHYGWRRARCE